MITEGRKTLKTTKLIILLIIQLLIFDYMASLSGGGDLRSIPCNNLESSRYDKMNIILFPFLINFLFF